MKLLNPTQAKESFVTKQSTDVTQIAYLKTVLADTQKAINTETAKFNQNLEDQRKVYYDEKVALQGEIKALEGILQAKRDERASLMIPIITLKQDAEKLVKEIEIKKAKVTEREEELNDLIENLQAKLDNLSSRENEIVNTEAVLLNRKIGIDEESEIVSSGHERLNGMMADFNKKVADKSTELAEREKKVEIERMRIKEFTERKEKEFGEIERGLADKRQALERGFAELKRLQDNNKK